MDDKSKDKPSADKPGSYSTIEEQISAFVDGELPVEEMDLLLRRLERDESYRETFSRYCLMGDLLRGDAGQSDRIRSGVMQQVTELEEPAQAPAAPIGRMSRARMAGLSVAAGVCAIAVLNILPDNSITTFGSGSSSQVAAVSQPESTVDALRSPQVRQTDAQQDNFSERLAAGNDEQRKQRMASYLASHSSHGRTISWRVAEPGFTVQQARYEP